MNTLAAGPEELVIALSSAALLLPAYTLLACRMYAETLLVVIAASMSILYHLCLSYALCAVPFALVHFMDALFAVAAAVVFVLCCVDAVRPVGASARAALLLLAMTIGGVMLHGSGGAVGPRHLAALGAFALVLLLAVAAVAAHERRPGGPWADAWRPGHHHHHHHYRVVRPPPRQPRTLGRREHHPPVGDDIGGDADDADDEDGAPVAPAKRPARIAAHERDLWGRPLLFAGDPHVERAFWTAGGAAWVCFAARRVFWNASFLGGVALIGAGYAMFAAAIGAPPARYLVLHTLWHVVTAVGGHFALRPVAHWAHATRSMYARAAAGRLVACVPPLPLLARAV